MGEDRARRPEGERKRPRGIVRIGRKQGSNDISRVPATPEKGVPLKGGRETPVDSRKRLRPGPAAPWLSVEQA